MPELWAPRGDGSIELSVGALAADLLNLGRDIERLRSAGVHILHFDLMDGRFCPELTVGSWFVEATKTELAKDVHLLVANPEDWVEPCARAGAEIITVHVESSPHVHRALEMITETGDQYHGTTPLRGIGICPGTPIHALEPLLDVVDIVYVLGVNPGWRQKLLPSTAERVRSVQDLLTGVDRTIRVAVDGGVTVDNFDKIASLGPDLIVSGSAVFGGDLETNVRRMKEAVTGEPTTATYAT